jgi:hypothetical protein
MATPALFRISEEKGLVTRSKVIQADLPRCPPELLHLSAAWPFRLYYRDASLALSMSTNVGIVREVGAAPIPSLGESLTYWFSSGRGGEGGSTKQVPLVGMCSNTISIAGISVSAFSFYTVARSVSDDQGLNAHLHCARSWRDGAAENRRP